MYNSENQTGITVGSYLSVLCFDFLYGEDQSVLFWGVARAQQSRVKNNKQCALLLATCLSVLARGV